MTEQLRAHPARRPAPAERIALVVVNGDGELWVWRDDRSPMYSALESAEVPPGTDPAAVARRCMAAKFGILGCGPRLRLVAWRAPDTDSLSWSKLFAYTCVQDHQPAADSPLGGGGWADDDQVRGLIAHEALSESTAQTLRCYAAVAERRGVGRARVQ